MVKTYDVGSMPFLGDYDKFLRGLKLQNPLLELLQIDKDLDDKIYFENIVVQSLIDKYGAGLDITNYPQFRDMNKMFLEMVRGISKIDGGYRMSSSMSINKEQTVIPEVYAIRGRLKDLHEKVRRLIKVKLCVTGPYTLSTLFKRMETDLFEKIGSVLSQIVEDNLFKEKYGETVLLTIDEPVFGFLDDPRLDYGAEGREALIKIWESIFHKAKSRGVETSIHLHNTTNDLFWLIRYLDIIESHVDDPLYHSTNTLELLDKEDKFLKASISITDFDTLIRNYIKSSSKVNDESIINKNIADTWRDISRNRIEPSVFLERLETVKTRLLRIIDKYGQERVPYAGPECGFRSFPTYQSAIKSLKTVADAASIVNDQLGKK